MNSPKIFTVKSRMIHEGRFDPEYHYALLNGNINSPYQLVKLLSLAYFKTGGTPSTDNDEYWGGSLPWISAKDFKTFRFEDSEDHITELAAQDATTYVVDKPALLMVSRSGILQHSLPVMITYKRTAINQDIKAFFPDNRVSVDYLGAFFDLFGKNLLPLLCKSGATVQSINTNELMNLPIPVPPPDTQKQIVAELDAAYAAKRKADAKAAELLNSIDRVVLNALGIPPIPPPDTSLPARIFTVSSRDVADKRLDAIAYQSARREFLKSINASSYSIQPVGALVEVKRTQTDTLAGQVYVGMENIDGNTGEFMPSENKETISSGIMFREDDILVPRLRPYLNKILLATFDGVASTEFYPLVAQGISAEFLAVFLRTKMIANVLTMLMTGNTLPRVQIEDILALPIPVPPEPIQKKIAGKVSAIRTEVRRVKSCTDKALSVAKRKIENELIHRSVEV